MTTDITTTIQTLCQKGYELYTTKDYDGALRLFYQAWLQIPKPQMDHSIAATPLAAIGDTYYRMRKYKQAIEALRSGLACQETPERQLILMRLGQALYDSQEESAAKTYLFRAYNFQNNDIFSSERPLYRHAIADLIN